MSLTEAPNFGLMCSLLTKQFGLTAPPKAALLAQNNGRVAEPQPRLAKTVWTTLHTLREPLINSKPTLHGNHYNDCYRSLSTLYYSCHWIVYQLITLSTISTKEQWNQPFPKSSCGYSVVPIGARGRAGVSRWSSARERGSWMGSAAHHAPSRK